MEKRRHTWRWWLTLPILLALIPFAVVGMLADETINSLPKY